MTTLSSVYGESSRVYPVITYQVEPCFFYEGVGRVELELEKSYLRPYYTRMQYNGDDEPKEMVRNYQLITLSEAQRNAILDVLDNLPSSYPKHPMGCCDGSTYDLKIEAKGFFLQSHYRWWCELPEEWANLQPLLVILEAHISFESDMP